VIVLVKMCRYHPNLRCFRSSCSVFDFFSGLVSVCRLHGNPNGFFMKRKVVGV